MQAAESLVVATTFASNVARLKTLAEAGRAAGRQVVVLGRAMNTMLKTAHAAEVLDGFPQTLDVLDIDSVPRRNLLVLATGSQGERRAASAQLAQGRYMGLELRPGDTFLFSSKTIPGNEVAVARILNQLSREGRDGHRRIERPLPRLRPRQPPRPRDAADAGAAEDAGADARRAPAPLDPRRPRRGAGHRHGRGAERHAARPDRRPAARRRAHRNRPGLSRRHRADRRDGRGGARPHPHGAARQGRGQRHHRRSAAARSATPGSR